MFEDDPRLPKSVSHEIGADLSKLSIAELKERVDLLRTEIRRIEAELEAKGSSRDAAESLFNRR